MRVYIAEGEYKKIMSFDFNKVGQALNLVNQFASAWSTGSTVSADGTTSAGGTQSSVDKKDVKEYNQLLEKQKNGTITSKEEARLRELRSSLSKAGMLNNNGSVKTRTNNDKIKRAAQSMSWEEASVWGAKMGGSAARIVSQTSTRAMNRQAWAQGGSMSMNGSIFGGRRV